MSPIEIIAGVTLLISCVIIIILVMLQSSKGSGLSGAIGGGSYNDARGKAKANDAKLARLTKIFAIIFFVITLVVNVVSLIG